jgi:hypothetical protein
MRLDQFSIPFVPRRRELFELGRLFLRQVVQFADVAGQIVQMRAYG